MVNNVNEPQYALRISNGRFPAGAAVLTFREVVGQEQFVWAQHATSLTVMDNRGVPEQVPWEFNHEQAHGQNAGHAWCIIFYDAEYLITAAPGIWFRVGNGGRYPRLLIRNQMQSSLSLIN